MRHNVADEYHPRSGIRLNFAGAAKQPYGQKTEERFYFHQ
jgi:hypothetical protein